MIPQLSPERPAINLSTCLPALSARLMVQDRRIPSVVESRRGPLSAGFRSLAAPLGPRAFRVRLACRQEPAQFSLELQAERSAAAIRCEFPRECSVKDQSAASAPT